MVEIPRLVRDRALVAGNARWLEDVPRIVRSLEREWGIEVGATLEGGSEGFVALARQQDGTPAVLKLMPDLAAGVHELTVLRLANGEGCARLLRDDPARGAMLLEKLGRPLAQLDRSPAEELEILCASVSRLWRPAPDSGLPTGSAKGRWLVEFMTATWEQVDRPCSRRSLDHALACAERRIDAFDAERAVLVHGDVHAANALEADVGFKLIDPDGLLADAEYDLGILIREDSLALMGNDPFARSRWLAARTGRDATAIWEWSVVERLSTGLTCTQIGLQPLGRELLAVADALAGVD